MDAESRLQALEDAVFGGRGQQLTYPLDLNSSQVVKQALSTNLVQLLYPQLTNNASEGTFTDNSGTPTLNLVDGSTKIAYFSFIPPSDLVISSLQIIWSTSATSGVMKWNLTAAEAGQGETHAVRILPAPDIITPANSVANTLNFTQISPTYPLSTLKKGNLWTLNFTRLGGDAADTLSANVAFYGILVSYKLFN